MVVVGKLQKEGRGDGMSAYMVDRNHVSYLVKAAMSQQIQNGCGFRWWVSRGGESRSMTCMDYALGVELGQMLWDANKESINARYPDTVKDMEHAPGPIGENYTFNESDITNGGIALDMVQVLKACDCYEYQSCEHEGWHDSEAYDFIHRLRARAWQALPGYDDAEWGAPEPHRIAAIFAS